VSYDALGSFLNQNENQTKSPVALAKSPHQFVFRLVDTTAIIEPHGAVLRRQGFFAQLFGKRGQSTTLFTVGHDPRLIDLSWKDDRTLLIRYPSDSAILPNFAVNRNGKAFKLSASDMPQITTSPFAKCHPSRDGCGEGPKAVGETSQLHSQLSGELPGGGSGIRSWCNRLVSTFDQRKRNFLAKIWNVILLGQFANDPR
jgi:hypothetical protein